MSKPMACVAGALAAVGAACGPSSLEAACNRYVDSVVACFDEAYADDATGHDAAVASLEDACVPYVDLTGNAAAVAMDQLGCFATTYDRADCSDPVAASYVAADASQDCAVR